MRVYTADYGFYSQIYKYDNYIYEMPMPRSSSYVPGPLLRGMSKVQRALGNSVMPNSVFSSF